MFERSLVISQEQHASAGQRWTAAASITLQVGVAAVLVLLPILHPEALSLHSGAPKVLLPRFKMPTVKLVPLERSATTAPTNIFVPTQVMRLQPPVGIPHGIPDAIPLMVSDFMPMSAGLPNALATSNVPTRPVRVMAAKPTDKPMRVSAGVSAGMLMVPIQPVYPAIAKAAHIEGTVVVEATISKAGRIESLCVTSGPEMLRAAAMDAIRSARYQPYKLSGEPIEVQTTITVNFKMQS
jgi:protein TonB